MSILLALEALFDLAGPVVILAGIDLRAEYDPVA
jgi:hypothetical protein